MAWTQVASAAKADQSPNASDKAAAQYKPGAPWVPKPS